MYNQLERAASFATEWMTRRRLVCFVLFVALYFTTFVRQAAQRPFWFDELFTLYTSTQPTVVEIFKRVEERVDQQPPPYYLVHRAFLALAGDAEPLILLRLPEMLGVLLGVLCVFELVRRRASDLYGWLAALLLLNSNVAYYAVEGRPYGLVVGFTALAALAYQLATDDRRRRLALAALAISLFAAVSSSYYAVLAFFPFGLVEAYRLWKRRRIDWGVLGALGAAGALTAVYVPVALSNVGGFDAVNWASPSLSKLHNNYARLLGDLSPLAAFALMGWGLWKTLEGRRQEEAATRETPFIPGRDWVLMVGFVLLPAVMFAVAVLVTHKMHERYVTEAQIGFAALGALFCFTAGWKSPKILALGLLVVLGARLLWFQTRPALLRPFAPSADQHELVRLLEEQPPGLPVVVDNLLTLLVMGHRNHEGIRDRLYYLVDRPNARRLNPDIVNGGEHWLRTQRYFPIQAVERAEFLRRHPEFLLYYNSGFGYLLPLAREEGAEVRLVAIGSYRDQFRGLFRVRYSSSSGADSNPTASSIR